MLKFYFARDWSLGKRIQNKSLRFPVIFEPQLLSFGAASLFRDRQHPLSLIHWCSYHIIHCIPIHPIAPSLIMCVDNVFHANPDWFGRRILFRRAPESLWCCSWCSLSDRSLLRKGEHRSKHWDEYGENEGPSRKDDIPAAIWGWKRKWTKWWEKKWEQSGEETKGCSVETWRPSKKPE